MAKARLIVLEQSCRWAIALRWSLRGRDICVHSSPNWDACYGALTASPASILLVELNVLLESNGTAAADCLANLADRFPAARWIALGTLADEPALWLAREMGAVDALSSTRNLAPAVKLIRRHLEAVSDAVGGVRDRVWQRMPLQEYESATSQVN